MGKKYDVVLAVIIAILYETITPTGKITLFSHIQPVQCKHLKFILNPTPEPYSLPTFES